MQNRGQYGTVNVEMLVLKSHLYRKLEKLISFKKISYRLKKLTEEGYGKERIFKMLIIQGLSKCKKIMREKCKFNAYYTQLYISCIKKLVL